MPIAGFGLRDVKHMMIIDNDFTSLFFKTSI